MNKTEKKTQSVWKYWLEERRTEVFAPQGAKTLTVGVQVRPEDSSLVPCVWLQVDPGMPREKRVYVAVATGEAVTGLEDFQYVQTFVMPGQIVWHVYEEVSTGGEGD